jgi:hypothetical protein
VLFRTFREKANCILPFKKFLVTEIYVINTHLVYIVLLQDFRIIFVLLKKYMDKNNEHLRQVKKMSLHYQSCEIDKFVHVQL